MATVRYPEQERIARAQACISRYMKLTGVSEDRMAERLHVTIRTIQNRRQHPERMKLDELWDMADILKCPIGELAGGELPEEMLGRILQASIKKGVG